MKHRFLLHSLNHTVLVVDITQIGLPRNVCPREGEEETVPTRRFQTWKEAEEYFLGLGAHGDTLDKIRTQLKKAGVDVLTIA